MAIVMTHMLKAAITLLQCDRASLRRFLEELANPCLELLPDEHSGAEISIDDGVVRVAEPPAITVHPDRGDETQLREANWLVASLEKRRETLSSVAEAVMQLSAQGTRATTTAIAERCGLHISTVKRVLQDKVVSINGIERDFADLTN